MLIESRLQQQFEPFRTEVLELEAQCNEAPNANIFDSRYVAGDSLKSMFELEDGVHLAKIARSTPDGEIPAADYIQRKVPALIKGIGVSCLEQIVAFSPINPTAIVTRRIEGSPLLELDRDAISLNEYSQLFDAFAVMDQLGLRVLDHHWDKQVLNSDPLSITGYEISYRQIAQPQLLSFAEFMSWGGRPGSPIRSDAMRYYVACDKLLGKEAGLEVINYWLHKRRAIPSIDYDCFDRDV